MYEIKCGVSFKLLKLFENSDMTFVQSFQKPEIFISDNSKILLKVSYFKKLKRNIQKFI